MAPFHVSKLRCYLASDKPPISPTFNVNKRTLYSLAPIKTLTGKKQKHEHPVARVYLLVDELLEVVEDVGVVGIQGHEVLHRVVLRRLLGRHRRRSPEKPEP